MTNWLHYDAFFQQAVKPALSDDETILRLYAM
jgi:hypothetical protein